MWYRRVYSKVAFFAVWAVLLLSTASIVFFVSSTGYQSFNCFTNPPTQSTSVTDSIRETEIQSIPTTGIIQENQSAVLPTNSTQETEPTPDEIVGTVFYVIPQELTVNIGNIFSVFVFAQNVTDMYSWQIKLSFDPEIAQCINVSVPGRHVFSNGYTVSQALIDYNNTEFTKRPLQYIRNNEGSVMAGDGLLGDNQTTFYGSGFLCKITFKAIASGSSKLDFVIFEGEWAETFCLDSGLKTIIPSVSSGKVTVSPE